MSDLSKDNICFIRKAEVKKAWKGELLLYTAMIPPGLAALYIGASNGSRPDPPSAPSGYYDLASRVYFPYFITSPILS